MRYGLLFGLWVWRRRTNRRSGPPPMSNLSYSPWTARPDVSGRWDNRMVAQHLPRNRSGQAVDKRRTHSNERRNASNCFEMVHDVCWSSVFTSKCESMSEHKHEWYWGTISQLCMTSAVVPTPILSKRRSSTIEKTSRILHAIRFRLWAR